MNDEHHLIALQVTVMPLALLDMLIWAGQISGGKDIFYIFVQVAFGFNAWA